MPQDLINLIYASSATQAFTEEELLTLLNQARANNTRLNVTGMLLYRGGNFLQVLEGGRTVVKDLFQKIAKDPRHREIIAFSERPVSQRHFGDWSMGFQNLDRINLTDIPGYTPFLDTPLNSEAFQGEGIAYTFLQTFKQHIL